MSSSSELSLNTLKTLLLSIWGEQNYFFSFYFCAWFGMLLKGVCESFLLSKDEPLTPNIDGVMALWFFRRGAQKAENRQKLDLWILVFNFFARAPSSVLDKSTSAEQFGSRRVRLANSGSKPTTITWWKNSPQFCTGHFPKQIDFSALWVTKLIVFWGFEV